MENFRGILALICAFVAAALVVTALWRLATHRSSAGRLQWLYAALFAIVSVVLWQRGANPGSPPVAQQPAVIPPATVPVQRPPIDTSSVDTSPGTSPLATRTSPQLTTSPAPESPPATVAQSPVRIASSEPAAPRTKPARKKPTARPHPAAPPVEDRIEHAITSAFDFVEIFFDRYAWTASESASESPISARAPAAPRRGVGPLAFPAVNFYSGSAELTGDSQTALKELAEELAARPQLGVLEIQARIDSVGPEAFNNILTQARASVVRDFLVSAGVPSERLVARGLGSDTEHCAKDGSPIEFVVRR
jgi:outer membrane protein OmpA-like peptidoglycan-associated protein